MQKRIEDKLYVFDLVPFEITDGTDAEAIYVQYEHVAGYKELNAELAEKIFGFNQFIMTVNPPVWAQAEPEPGPEGHTLTFSTNDSSKFTMTIGGESVDLAEGSWSDIDENTEIIITPTFYMHQYTVFDTAGTTAPTADTDNDRWIVTMPNEDITVQIMVGQYSTLTFSTNDSSKFTMTIGDAPADPSQGTYAYIEEDTEIKIYPTETMSNYDDQSNLTVVDDDPSNPYWYLQMPPIDHTITIDYNGDEESESSSGSEGHTLTFSTNDSSKFTMTINGSPYTPSDGPWTGIMENDEIRIYPTIPAEMLTNYDDQSNLTVDNDDPSGTCWVATMPDNDYTITIDYIGGGESESGNGESE